MARDLPRGWVLPDAAIQDLARTRPRTREALAAIAAVPRGTAARAAAEILAILHDAPQVAGAAEAELDARPGPEQVRQLKAAGLVIEEPRGTRRVYQLHRRGVVMVQTYLRDVWGATID